MAECKRCLFKEPVVVLNDKGVCNLCEMHDEIEKHSKLSDWYLILKKIQNQKRKYHCLIGISGGLDSSLLLEMAIKKWKLNPLVIHFDNGWNCRQSNNNIDIMVKSLGVDFIRYSISQKEYDEINKCFLLASVSDADIPNDMAMAEMMLRTAHQYGIKYILNGHNFRTEGSSPLTWSYMDSKYIESVYEQFSGKKIKSFPLLTFRKQLFYNLLRIKKIDPFHYLEVDINTERERLKKEYGWRDYGPKHSENIYTGFIGAYYLPEKFNIDKRITYESALIRSGKERKELGPRPEYNKRILYKVLHRTGVNKRLFKKIMESPPKTHTDYKTYHSTFKKWKFVFYVMMKLNLIQYTFYKKYTQ